MTGTLTVTENAVPKPKTLPDAQTVTAVTHWTDRLFSFRVSRPQTLRFRSGEFVMIGLMDDNGRPLLRAYSIASPSWDEELEFYSIKVPDGPLTSRLQHIEVGDQIILRPKPVGTLVLDALLPGEHLWFLATGTGLAPFASLMRDPETYEKFEQVIMMHTCRTVEELEYGRRLVEGLKNDPLIGEMVEGKLLYYPRREPKHGQDHRQPFLWKSLCRSRLASHGARARPRHGLRQLGLQRRRQESARRLWPDRGRKLRPPRIRRRKSLRRRGYLIPPLLRD